MGTSNTEVINNLMERFIGKFKMKGGVAYHSLLDNTTLTEARSAAARLSSRFNLEVLEVFQNPFSNMDDYLEFTREKELYEQ